MLRLLSICLMLISCAASSQVLTNHAQTAIKIDNFQLFKDDSTGLTKIGEIAIDRFPVRESNGIVRVFGIVAVEYLSKEYYLQHKEAANAALLLAYSPDFWTIKSNYEDKGQTFTIKEQQPTSGNITSENANYNSKTNIKVGGGLIAVAGVGFLVNALRASSNEIPQNIDAFRNTTTAISVISALTLCVGGITIAL